MSRPLVSVALATYQGEGFLREQLETIYAQSWPNIEVVASDDASHDGTVAILAEYAERRGLRYRANSETVGIAQNFGRALALCQGDMVALADQDDLWKPHKIARLVEAIDDATLIYCNIGEVIEPDGKRRIDPSHEPTLRFARAHGSGRPVRYLLAQNWVVSHSILFRRELLDVALPIPETLFYHDGWLALLAACRGGIRFLDEPLQTYRRHAQSFTYKDPANPVARRPLTDLWNGSFRSAWRQTCSRETARLKDAARRAALSPAEQEFLARLLVYYASGLAGGSAWRSFRAGFDVAPYFSTLHERPRWKVPLRALLGGI
jgi:glycosyltransferase involved in cell wall biosynthesis